MQMEIGDENGVGDDTSSRRVYFMDRETKWRHFMYLICAAYECVLARVCACVCVCLCNRNVYKLCEQRTRHEAKATITLGWGANTLKQHQHRLPLWLWLWQVAAFYSLSLPLSHSIPSAYSATCSERVWRLYMMCQLLVLASMCVRVFVTLFKCIQILVFCVCFPLAHIQGVCVCVDKPYCQRAHKQYSFRARNQWKFSQTF